MSIDFVKCGLRVEAQLKEKEKKWKGKEGTRKAKTSKGKGQEKERNSFTSK